MRQFCKRLWAMLLCLACLGGSLSAARADFGDWEGTLSGWLEREGAIRFSVALEAETLLPFTQEQTQRLNGLLQHLSFGASLEQDGGAALTAVSLTVGGQTAMTLIEREESGSFALETSLLPNRTLESREASPLELLAFGEDEAEDAAKFDLLAAMEEARESYPALMAACEPYMEKKKANYKIKDIGSAKWSEIARLTKEQSEEMLPQLRAVLLSGMDEAHRADLSEVRFDKGFVVARYKLGENDGDIAVYMKGNLIFPDGTKASIAYQWAFTAKGTEQKDTYKYEFSRKANAGPSRTVTASLTQKQAESELSVKGKAEMTIKGKGYSRTEEETIDLSGKSGGATRTLKGSYSKQVKDTQDGSTLTTLFTLTPDVALILSGDEALLSGTAKVEEKRDKVVTSGLLLTFAPELPEGFVTEQAGRGPYVVTEEADAAAPAGSLFQNLEEDPAFQPPEGNDYLVGSPPIGLTAYNTPQSPTTQDVDTAAPEQLASLRQEMAQNLAGRLLLALSSLPEEALAVFQEGLTDEDFENFLSLLENS